MNARCQYLLITVALLFSLFAFAEPCAQTPATPSVKRSFKLKVTDDRNTPRHGVKVTLGTLDRYHALHPVSVGVTDTSGVLVFAKLDPGAFTLQFNDPDGERQRFDVHVAATGGDPTLDYTWVNANWISLRAASAILKSGTEPLRHYQLTLQGYPDGEDLGTSDTDLDGRFDLPAVRPGRYYVALSQPDSVSGGKKYFGRIPIIVTQDDRYPAVDTIFVEANACGLSYDQYCTQTPAKLEGWCIQTVDAKGAPIPKAAATLKSLHASVGSTNLRADDTGTVRVPSLAGGDYELEIFAKSFTPVRRFLTIVPGLASCSTAIIVPMNPLGSGCAPAPPGKGN